MLTCIVVPSHISNVTRTKMLIRCLNSLIYQTVKNKIYLSISFETELDKVLFNKLIRQNDLLDIDLLCIKYREEKHSQFRHIEKVIDEIKDIHKYIMFCDDDDTYQPERVEIFNSIIEYGMEESPEGKIFVGAYEKKNIKTHSEEFHEYWSYCVDINFIMNFIKNLKDNGFDNYLDNKMCDVIFASYLRSLNSNHVFGALPYKLYNYNKNEHSITGQIKQHNDNNKVNKKTPTTDFKLFIDCANEQIHKEIDGMRDNIIMFYAIGRITFDEILKRTLIDSYKYIDHLDKNIVETLQDEYNNIKSLCDILYHW